MTVLVAYASKHGATAEIAHAIAQTLCEEGLDADPVSAGSADPGEYDAVILGSSIYAGSWLAEAVTFARVHAGTISARPCWLFSSGPLGDVEPLVEEQPAELGELVALLDPRWHTMFPGAYDPEVLGFGERMIMKAVKAVPGDYREWDRIHDWAREIAAELSSGD